MTKAVHTTCPYCGVGCGVVVTQNDEGQVSVKGDTSHPANLGRLCSKGSALAETVDLEGRLLHPHINGELTDWDTALDSVANGLKNVVDEHGPDAVAFYVSGQLLTEDYYVANKLMKGYIGSANIDTNSRLCMSSAVAGHKRAFGKDTVANCYEDLETADLIVLIGSNAAWCHPVLYQRMKAAAEGRDDLRIIVVDPRKTASCDGAWLHLPIKPGSDVVLFNGLLRYLVENDYHDTNYINANTQNFEQALQSAIESSPDITTVAKLCDVPAEDIEKYYQAFASTKKSVSLFSQGVNQSSSGTDKVNSIINCHLATGRIGLEGCGAFSITGQPNAMGGREVGGLANMLAAHMDFAEDDVDRVQRFWSSPVIAKQPGLKAIDLFEAVEQGQIKAVWIMATNPVVSMPNADRVKAALKKCDLVIASDCIQNTDTTECADILLPATGWAEKTGTVTNSERRISRMRSFMPPSGEARHDWWIISQVAQRMGYVDDFNYQNPVEVFREHAALSGFENTGERDFDISGLSELTEQEYEDFKPRQWPVKQKDDSSKRLMSDGLFYTSNQKANFLPLSYNPVKHNVSEEYPLSLNTGRVRDHWHTMTRTGKAATLSRHIIEPYATINPATAEKLDLEKDQLVDVASENGSITVRLKVSEDQRDNEIFVPIHWNAQFASSARVDALVFPAVDPFSGQPEFKSTPVSVKASQHVWHGFILSREKLKQPDTDYWALAIEESFWRYEIAGYNKITDWCNWLSQQLENADLGDVIEYADPHSGTKRLISFKGGQIETCVFIASDYTKLPSRDWLLSQFSESEFDSLERSNLLSGRPAEPSADTGPVICSCFNVGQNTIKNAIVNQGLETVEQIGKCLKAGTNCGSCKPELKTLLNETSVELEAVKKSA